jgi:hypothetical protein
MLRSSEDYDFWLRAALAGVQIRFNPTPLGYYRRRSESVSADHGAMLASITAVLRKLAPSVSAGSPESAALDRQLRRFDFERTVNDAKVALHRREFAAAADLFQRMAAQRDSLKLKLVARIARFAPQLLLFAHRTRLAIRQRARSRRALTS